MLGVTVVVPTFTIWPLSAGNPEMVTAIVGTPTGPVSPRAIILKSHEPGSRGGFNEVDRIANGITGMAGTVPGGTNDAGLCTWKPITSRSTNAFACTVTVVGRVISNPARDKDTFTVLYCG